MRRILILAFLSLFCATSCFKESDASDIILFVTPSAQEISSGGKIKFEIRTWTIHERLTKIEISSFDSQNGIKTLFCETSLSDRYTGVFEYEAPVIKSDVLDVEMSFVVSDSQNHSSSTKISIKINNKGEPLTEETAITLYSAYSANPNAYSLVAMQPIKAGIAPETEQDIYMYAPEDGESDEFAPEWRSKTGVKFVRANNMNYPSVTKYSLEVFYENSPKADNVSELKSDDIIIVGKESAVLGVFKIISVHDEEGVENDRIILNYKHSTVD